MELSSEIKSDPISLAFFSSQNLEFSTYTNTSDNETSKFSSGSKEMSKLNKWVVTTYIIFLFVAGIANSVTLCSVVRRKRVRWSRIPLLIMHLCMADLIVIFSPLATEVFWQLTVAGIGGKILCKLSQFGRSFGLYLSCNVVICISIDRYYTVLHPLSVNGALKRVKFMVTIAWIVAVALASPHIFFRHTTTHSRYSEFQQCITKAFIEKNSFPIELVYNVCSVAALYIIPLFVIIYTHTKILWELRRTSREQQTIMNQQGTATSSQNAANDTQSADPPSNQTRLIWRCTANQNAALERTRSNTLRLTFLIILTFIICWTPYVVMTMWYMFDRLGASQVDSTLQEILFMITVVSSVINPIIYGTVGGNENCMTWVGIVEAITCGSFPRRARQVPQIHVERVNTPDGRKSETELRMSRNCSPSPSMHVVLLPHAHGSHFLGAKYAAR